LLWPYLDHLTERLISYYRNNKKPNFIHAHYADAGYVGVKLSKCLKVPLIFTGHSLGREKKRKLLDTGLKSNQIEKLYAISKRIEAEEKALKSADIVVTSTKQESVYQYSQYSSFSPHKARVIPPGVDHNKFHHIHSTTETAEIENMMKPFLKDSTKPPLLNISRAVRRKNIPSLIEAYGRSEKLKRKTNLILILGCRDNTSKLDPQQKDVFHNIFEMIDHTQTSWIYVDHSSLYNWLFYSFLSLGLTCLSISVMKNKFIQKTNFCIALCSIISYFLFDKSNSSIKSSLSS